jgi:hypothetical protein
MAACCCRSENTTKGIAMKKFIALTLVTLGITVSARAQWVVFDPTAQIQSILNTAQEIAQFVTMIENQVQQIQTLGDQLNEFKNYESLFRNPSESGRCDTRARVGPGEGLREPEKMEVRSWEMGEV